MWLVAYRTSAVVGPGRVYTPLAAAAIVPFALIDICTETKICWLEAAHLLQMEPVTYLQASGWILSWKLSIVAEIRSYCGQSVLWKYIASETFGFVPY
jgi:hypothetical protein